MPSPFAKYQGEQVPQLNILPYTQAMANNTQQALTGLGANIGKAIENYRAAKDEREFLKAQVMAITGKYIVQDPTEDAPKNVVKADAPDHISQIATKAINSEDGWDGLSSSDMRGFLANHQRVQADARIAFDEDYKTKTLANDKERVRLAAEAQKLAAADSYWRIKKAKEEDDIQKAKIAAINADIDPIQRHTFTKREDVKTGTVTNPETGAEFTGPVADAATYLGIKPEDIVSQKEYDALVEGLKGKPEQVVGRIYSRNPSFNASLPLEKQDATKTKDEDGVVRSDAHRFIEGMYKASIRAGVNPDAAKRLFFTNKETGNLNSDINVNEETWAVAQKLATKPSIQSLLKREGKNLTPPAVTGINKFVISDTGTQEVSRKVSTEIKLNEREVWDAKYESMAEKWRASGKMVPFSREQLDVLIGDKSVPSMKLPNGQRVYVFGNKPYTEAQLNALANGVDVDGGVASDETMAHAKLVQFDNWVRQFNKPTELGGGIKVQFKGGYRQFRGDMEKDKEGLDAAMRDLPKVNKVADAMLKMTNESWLSKQTPAWNVDYENLKLTAQTMRQYFIAKGPETEPDNVRLSAIVADQGQWLKANPELAKRIIENFRNIVVEQTKQRLENAGFAVSSGGAKVDKSALHKLLEEAEAKFAPKK